MFKKLLSKFIKLPDSNKSMVYLMWIYWVWWIIWNFFINIFIYQKNNSIEDVIIYNLFFILSTFIWFSILWYLFSLFRKDIKYMYYFSYILFIISFLILFINKELYFFILIFAILYWLWNWMFWCWIHTQELFFVKDKYRDLYSSSIYIWLNINGIITPLIVATIFLLSDKIIKINAYLVLFFILPFVYSISFLFIKKLNTYIPNKVSKKEFYNFFNFKKYKFALFYIFFSSLHQWILLILWPIISIYLLKNEVSVWLFEWLMAFLSIFSLIIITYYRNISNRIKIMWYIIIFIFINNIIFSLNFTKIWYIYFILIWIIIMPIYRVSEHIYDLQIMDSIKLKWKDFFSAMLFRDLVIFISRLLLLLSLLLIISIWIDLENILKFSIVLIPLFMFFSWLSIYFYLKFKSK